MAHRTLTVAMVLLVVAIFWVSSTVLDRHDPQTPSLSSNAEVTATLDEKPKPTLKRFVFTVNGQERTAALHVPKGVSTATPMPLFVVFHGGKDSTARAITNNWSSMFDQGVLLVFPNGQRDRPDDPAWNVDDPADLQDVDLTRELLRVLEREYSVDPERRYIAGFSNGGMQTMMLMCHASELFAGAAVVHQTLHNHLAETCQPRRHVPLLYINGTADAQWSGRYFSRSAPDTFEWWSRRHGCKLKSLKREAIPDRADDGTTVERWRFGRCDRAQMEMLRIEGGGHSWPGSQFSGDDHCLDIDATREITDFWRSHAALGG